MVKKKKPAKTEIEKKAKQPKKISEAKLKQLKGGRRAYVRNSYIPKSYSVCVSV